MPYTTVTASRSPSPDHTLPESSPAQGSHRADSASSTHPHTVSVTPQQAARDGQKGRARMEQALARIRDQQRAATQTLKLDSAGQSVVVNPAAMAWARTLIAQGAITIEQGNVNAEPAIDRTGLAQFDREQTIAARNANAMAPYLAVACDRLHALENPPTTQQQCDELREQLELYFKNPESYEIRGSDGECIVLQTQTLRAYSEALSSIVPPQRAGILGQTAREYVSAVLSGLALVFRD